MMIAFMFFISMSAEKFNWYIAMENSLWESAHEFDCIYVYIVVSKFPDDILYISINCGLMV